MAFKNRGRLKDKELNAPTDTPVRPDPDDAGQAGDTQGLSDVPSSASESVRELAQEGQFYEAAILSGVEDAPDADVEEVRTREVPEDDVPPEYLEQEDVKEE